jgi:hypothetical protein
MTAFSSQCCVAAMMMASEVAGKVLILATPKDIRRISVNGY